MDTILKVLDQIRQGSLRIKWDSWCFTGGRDWGDWDMFKIYNLNGTEYGFLELNQRNGLNISQTTVDQTICYESEDENVFKEAEKLVYEVIKRDDPEIVAMLSRDGEFLGFPKDFGDISRTEVLNGKWSW